LVSPDGRWVALHQQGGEYTTEVLVFPFSREGLTAGSPIRAARGLFVVPLGWRRDELLILFRSNTKWEVQRWNAGSRQLNTLSIPELTARETRLQAATVSRDGRRMVIACMRLDTDIWQAELSEAGESLSSGPLIASTYLDMSVDWSRDGRRIIFKSTRSGSHEAWIADPDGLHPRQLTHIGGLGDPRLSPDGNEIVFNRGEGGNPEIYVAAVETRKIGQITQSPAEETNSRWSRNEAYNFDSDRTGRPEIWKISRAGGEPVQVTRNGGSNAFESPDGRYLHYGRNGHVWRMPLDGGQEEQLFESLVNWTSLYMGSPHMYFVRGDSGFPGYGTDIYSYNLASGRIRKVLETGNPVVTLACSPDERHIIYGCRTLADSDLMLVEFPR
jgi:Tol biopolymer transport system component